MPPKRSVRSPAKGKAQQPIADGGLTNAGGTSRPVRSIGDGDLQLTPGKTQRQLAGRWTVLPVAKATTTGLVGDSAVSRAAVEAVGIDVACAAVASCCGVESLGYPTREHVLAAVHTLEVPGSMELHDRLGDGRAAALLLTSVEQVLRQEADGARARRQRRHEDAADETSYVQVQEDVPPKPHQADSTRPGGVVQAASAALESVDRTLEAVEREMSLSPVPLRDDDADGWQLPRGAEWELHSSSSSSNSSHGSMLSGRLSELMEDDAENEGSEDDVDLVPGETVVTGVATEPQPAEKPLLVSPSQQQWHRKDAGHSAHSEAGSEPAAEEKSSRGSQRLRSLHLVPRSPDDRPGLSSYDPEPTSAQTDSSLNDAAETGESEPASRSDDLTKAAKDGDMDQVMELLRQGVDADCEDLGGWTALHYAANRDEVGVAELLISGGQADIEKIDRKGRTALTTAAMSGSPNVLQLLLEKGARWYSVDQDGKTALDWASGTGESAQLLREWEVEYGHLRHQQVSAGGTATMSKRVLQQQHDPQRRQTDSRPQPAGCLLIAAAVLTLLLCIDTLMSGRNVRAIGGDGYRSSLVDDDTSSSVAAASLLLQSACMQSATEHMPVGTGASNEETALQLWHCLRGAEQQAKAELAKRLWPSGGIWSGWWR